MKVGFTGTREGMTRGQKKHLEQKLKKLHVTEFHHGSCIGADEEAHAIAARMRDVKIVVHPPIDEARRAWCKGHEVREALPYMERNHAIVDETEILVVVPRRNEEELRSGTWATFRYAVKRNHPTIIIER